LTKQSITEKRSDGSFQVRFARRIPHPVERVWEALTDPAELRKWWGDADLELVDTIAAGWQLHLDALATILSGGQVDIAHPDPIFEPIHRAYTGKYGTPDD
jgi:hypothetical protein